MGAETEAPSEYIKGGSVYVSLESEERTLPYVLELFGEDHIFFASDYPMNANDRSISRTFPVSRRAPISPIRQNEKFCPRTQRGFTGFE